MTKIPASSGSVSTKIPFSYYRVSNFFKSLREKREKREKRGREEHPDQNERGREEESEKKVERYMYLHVKKDKEKVSKKINNLYF